MSYSNFAPETEIVEAQDATGFRIYDKSIWNGESLDTTTCIVSIAYTDDNDVVTTYDDYALISGTVLTKFLEYLSSDGHLINYEDLTIDAVPVTGDRFPDGYYEITIKFNDGSYALVDRPYYKDTQAFLAKYRAMKRTMPSLLLEWPITAEVREANYDIYTLGLYLDAAEDAADLTKKAQYRKFIALVRQIIDHYEISEPW